MMMSAKLVSVDGTKVKIEVVVELSNSMLTAEENIQKSLNPAGLMATEAALLKGRCDNNRPNCGIRRG